MNMKTTEEVSDQKLEEIYENIRNNNLVVDFKHVIIMEGNRHRCCSELYLLQVGTP